MTDPDPPTDLRGLALLDEIERLRAALEKRTIPDFGWVYDEAAGMVVSAKAMAPGVTLHELVVLYGEEAAKGQPAAGNPSRWPESRGVKAVVKRVLEAVYGAGEAQP